MVTSIGSPTLAGRPQDAETTRVSRRRRIGDRSFPPPVEEIKLILGTCPGAAHALQAGLPAGVGSVLEADAGLVASAIRLGL